MVQILRPCNLSFTISRTEGQGLRINTNISDLVFNISPYSFHILKNSIMAFYDSMSREGQGAEDSVSQSVTMCTNEHEDYSNLWTALPFKEDHFWFLRNDTDVGIEVTEATTFDSISSGISSALNEQAIIHINNLVITIEAGVGTNTTPLMLIESSLDVDVKNWSSSRMSAIGSMNLEVAYYNSKLALWEPVIEKVKITHNEKVIEKRWELNVTCQCNSKNDLGSTLVSPSLDEMDGFLLHPQMMPPLMAVSLQSRDVLEITVTKAYINVLKIVVDSFSEDAMFRDKKGKRVLPDAPFVVKNRIGKPVTVILAGKGASSFRYHVKDDIPPHLTEIKVEHGSDIYLVREQDRSKSQIEKGITDYLSPLAKQSQDAEVCLKIRVSGEKGVFEIPVSKADRRFFPFPFRGDEMGDHHGMVSQVEVDCGSKTVTFRSILEMKNHYSMRCLCTNTTMRLDITAWKLFSQKKHFMFHCQQFIQRHTSST